jgi:hypothetical protein
MIGPEKEKMELVPVSQITISRLFKTAAAMNKRVLLVIWLRRRQQRRSKQEKYKKRSIWIRKIFQERQWKSKSKYHLLL